MNKYQVNLRKDFDEFVENALASIEHERDELAFALEKSKKGTEVIIFQYGKSYQIQTIDREYLLSNCIQDRDKLIKMIEENGWILVEKS